MVPEIRNGISEFFPAVRVKVPVRRGVVKKKIGSPVADRSARYFASDFGFGETTDLSETAHLVGDYRLRFLSPPVSRRIKNKYVRLADARLWPRFFRFSLHLARRFGTARVGRPERKR